MKRIRILTAALVLILGAACLGADDVAVITAEALHQRLQANEQPPLVVDVREPDELEDGHIDGALLAPLASVENDLAEVPKDREIVLVCRSGRRSGIAYERLAARGFTRLWNMSGGMIAWEKLGYPTVKE